MEAWESINKVTNYIEENLKRKMSIEELSTIACLSPFYFQKLFKRLVGTTVMEYVKSRRLAKIADRLKGDCQGNMSSFLSLLINFKNVIY